MESMFPQFGAAVPSSSGPTSLLSFKAGKMEVKDKGNQVFHISPDVRKGLISLYKGADDHLMHFTWKERPSGTAVEDMIILPEEAVFKKVNTGREEDRVYLMEIGSSNRFFYWMQSKSSEKDEENMRKVNELMASPPADTQPGSQGAASSGAGDMMEMLRSMGTGASAQASLHDVGGSGATPSAPGSSSGLAGQGINIQNLQSILQNLGFSAQDQVQTSSTESTEGPSTATEASTSTPAQQPPQEIPTPSATSGSDETSAPASGPEASAVASAAASASTGGGSGGGLTTADLQRAMLNLTGMSAPPKVTPLNEIVNASAIEATGILDDPHVQGALTPLLPDGQQNTEELRTILRSPQLQQALSALSVALQSDNFNSIMSSFNLDPSNPASADALARGDAIEALMQALIHAAAQRKEVGKGEGDTEGEVKEGESRGSSS